MASFAKIAAVLLVLALCSAPALEARQLKAAQFTIANCRSYRTIGGGRRVCAGCTTGYLLIPGDGGCARQTTTAVRPGAVRPGGVYRQTTVVRPGMGRPLGH